MYNKHTRYTSLREYIIRHIKCVNIVILPNTPIILPKYAQITFLLSVTEINIISTYVEIHYQT